VDHPGPLNRNQSLVTPISGPMAPPDLPAEPKGLSSTDDLAIS
jgi:hypothetical protein